MIIGSWQAVLTLALLLFLILPMARLSKAYRLAVLLAMFLVALIPLSTGLTLAGLLRGLTDDLAITSVLWLVVASLIRLGMIPAMGANQKWPLWLCFAVLGLVLYPAALGLGMLDTYGWGYQPRGLIIAIALIMALMFCISSGMGVLLLSVATLAFLLDVKPSDNYWDYLLDPFIVLYSLGALLRGAYSFLKRGPVSAEA
ncbi:MAG: hypothetical protein CVV07_08385 [Gammaproteobacteria bacterium HGW-Gammaproteobacteria-11]|nr:MAG: hypothetical protein CVV07_08385 [Gammaproteobacteria bacterium HGW-Gammaproteobacteria-11]